MSFGQVISNFKVFLMLLDPLVHRPVSSIILWKTQQNVNWQVRSLSKHELIGGVACGRMHSCIIGKKYLGQMSKPLSLFYCRQSTWKVMHGMVKLLALPFLFWVIGCGATFLYPIKLTQIPHQAALKATALIGVDALRNAIHVKPLLYEDWGPLY